MTVIVDDERAADAAAIERVHAAAFPSDAEARLVRALRDDGALTISLVARVRVDDGPAPSEDEVVGHIAWSPVTVAGVTGGLGLAPVAVLPAWQRRGIAAQLIAAGLARCRARGVPFVVVLGEPAYYGRFGFTAARTFGIVDEYGGGDAFQALELTPGALAHAHGTVRYAPAFALVG